MRKIRKVLRLKHEQGFGNRKISRSVSSSPSTDWEYFHRAEVAGIKCPLPEGIDDSQLDRCLFPVDTALDEPGKRPVTAPDFAHVQRELRRKHMTILLLWQEYKSAHPDNGYQYSRFCQLFTEHTGKLDLVMRQTHKAGEKAYMDFSGDEDSPPRNQKTAQCTVDWNLDAVPETLLTPRKNVLFAILDAFSRAKGAISLVLPSGDSYNA